MNRRPLICLYFFAVAMGYMAPPSLGAWQQYRVIPLAGPGGPEVTPTALNDKGLVVGEIRVPATSGSGTVPAAFLWTMQSGIQVLPPSDATQTSRTAFGINNLGTAVGSSSKVIGMQVASGAVSWPTAAAAVEVPSAVGPLGVMNDINDEGVMVGATRSGSNRAVLYSPISGARILPQLPGKERGVALAVNNAGIAVGASQDEIPPGGSNIVVVPFATQWNAAGQPTALSTAPFASRDVYDSNAFDINDRGDVVGFIRAEVDPATTGGFFIDEAFAAFWLAGEAGPRLMPTRDLVPGGGIARFAYGIAINQSRVVVGHVRGGPTFNPSQNLAFLWSPADGAVLADDLLIDADAGWKIAQLTDVNEKGVAVGFGYDADGNHRAVMLVPVPEPNTFATLCIALMATGFARRRWRGWSASHAQKN